MSSVRILSVKQPWATLIVLGVKRYEARSWPPNWRGRIVIHASSSAIPKKQWAFLVEDPAVAKVLAKAGLRDYSDVTALPTSAIVGAVTVDDAQTVQLWGDAVSDLDGALSSFSPPEILWRLKSPVQCAPITGIDGKLNLWTLSGAAADEIVRLGGVRGKWTGEPFDDSEAKADRADWLADYQASEELVARRIAVPDALQPALGAKRITVGDAFERVFQEIFGEPRIPMGWDPDKRIKVKGAIASAAFPDGKAREILEFIPDFAAALLPNEDVPVLLWRALLERSQS